MIKMKTLNSLFKPMSDTKFFTEYLSINEISFLKSINKNRISYHKTVFNYRIARSWNILSLCIKYLWPLIDNCAIRNKKDITKYNYLRNSKNASVYLFTNKHCRRRMIQSKQIIQTYWLFVLRHVHM